MDTHTIRGKWERERHGVEEGDQFFSFFFLVSVAVLHFQNVPSHTEHRKTCYLVIYSGTVSSLRSS